VFPDVIEEGLDVFINEDHQDQTGEVSAHMPTQDEPAEDQQDPTGEGSAHRPPQDQPKLLTALKGIIFRKQIF